MKIFRTTSKKRVLISSGVGGVVGLTAWLLFRLYLHGVAYESTQPDPARDAAMQTAAQALGDGAASSPSTQAIQTTSVKLARTAQSSSLPPDDPKALWALNNAGAADSNGGAIDSSTFPFATSSGAKSRDGYPIYLIECNVGSHQCVGQTGQPIGSAAQVADTITPVLNTDALRYRCPDWICIDPQGNVVGSIAPTMRTYLAQRH